MKIISQILRPHRLLLLAFMGLLVPARAQTVSIPDPGLNAALREALQKPTGPLTQSDLLSLNFLSACCRGIKSLQGLEAARNLTILDLHSNSLTNLSLPSGMTNLSAVFLRSNQLTRLTLAPGLTHLIQIDVMGNQLTNLTLPPDLTRLTALVLEGNPLRTLVLPEPLAATNLAPVVANLPS